MELIAERAYLDLRERIVTLQLAPGTSLREEVLMRELRTGRTPLREAVKRLALEGFVAVQPRRGTRVTGIDAAGIVHITEVRAELEGHAAELAARRAPDGAARALLGRVAAGVGADPDALMALDRAVHAFVWEAAGNPYLRNTLELYFALSLRIWHLVLDRLPGFGHAVGAQAELLEALDARAGARARALMREHVLAFQREVIAALS